MKLRLGASIELRVGNFVHELVGVELLRLMHGLRGSHWGRRLLVVRMHRVELLERRLLRTRGVVIGGGGGVG